MTNDNIRIGQIIRAYRKANKMTLEELSEKINKSKSTLGKYEQGQISVEISVLNELAKVFHIRPGQFLTALEDSETAEDRLTGGGFRRYFYTYDGFSRRIMRGLMIISDPDSLSSPASLFYDIPSFDRAEQCRRLYNGRQERFDTITKYMMDNHSGIESPQLCFTRPLDYQGKESGIFFGISSRAQVPVALKCILSDMPLEENAALIEQLKISPEDLTITRKMNQFSIEPIF